MTGVNHVVTRIRVMLAHMPPMLQDVIRDAFRHQPDVEVVATIGADEPLLPALEAIRADVVIFGASSRNELALAQHAWARFPRIKVLTIADGGRSAVLHALRPHQVVLGDVSLESLLAAIRGAPAW